MSILRTFSSAASRPFFTPPITGVNGSNYWEKTTSFLLSTDGNYIEAYKFLWVAEDNSFFYTDSGKYTLTNGAYVSSQDLFLTTGNIRRIDRIGNIAACVDVVSSSIKFLERISGNWVLMADLPFTYSGFSTYWGLKLSESGNVAVHFFNPNNEKLRIYRVVSGYWQLIVDTIFSEVGFSCDSGNISGDGNTFAAYFTGVGLHYLVKVYKWNGTISDQTITNNWTKTGEISTAPRQVAAVYLNEDGTVLLVVTYEAVSGGSGITNYSFFYNAYKFDGTTWQQMGSTVNGVGIVSGSNPPSPEGQILNKEGNIFFVRTDASINARTVRAYKWNGTNWAQMGPTITSNNASFVLFLSQSGSKITMGRDPGNQLPIEQYQYIP